MVNTSGLARCPFALGSIRFCPFSFALSHFFPSLLFLLLYPWKSLHFSAKTDYLPIVVLRLCHVCLHNGRVCACVCTSVRMQQRSRQVNITVGTKQRELVRADVKWPTFLAVNSIPSTPFVHRHLFRLLTRLIRPFSFSLIPPPTFSHDFFSLLLFLCSCSSSSLPFARLEKRQDLPDVSLEEFKTKINRTTKKEGWFHAS